MAAANGHAQRDCKVPRWIVRRFLTALTSLLFTASASADQTLQLLRAEFEQRLSSIRSIEVSYTERKLEATPPRAHPYAVTVDWAWSQGREWCWQRSLEGAPLPQVQWAYDGRRTVEFNYVRDPPGKVQGVFVRPTPPSLIMVSHTGYSRLLGQRLKLSRESLSEAFDTCQPKLASSSVETEGPIVEFSTHGQTAEEVVLRVHFDASAPGMPIRIEEVYRQAARPDLVPPIPAREVSSLVVVEESIEAIDPLSGQSLRLPRRGRLDSRIGDIRHNATRIVVDRIHLNADVPHSRFELAIPFGARVVEESRVAGAQPQRYLAGGEAAVKAEMEARKTAVDAELAALAARGVRFDAAPPTNRITYWLALGGILCLLAVAVLRFARRGRA